MFALFINDLVCKIVVQPKVRPIALLLSLSLRWIIEIIFSKLKFNILSSSTGERKNTSKRGREVPQTPSFFLSKCLLALCYSRTFVKGNAVTLYRCFPLVLAVLRDSLNIGPGGCENRQIHASLLVKDLIRESDRTLAYPWDSPLTPRPPPPPRKPLLYRFFQVFKVRHYHSHLLNKPNALKLKWGFIRDLHC